MVDQLDLKILEIINNAPSLVRSVTEKEIESGVLFPSVSALDIKQNLTYNLDLNVIESRLKKLEDEGYIYFDTNRWWLTQKGKQILGKNGSKPFQPTIRPTKPMRKILEETFSRFELDRETRRDEAVLDNIEDTRNRRLQAENFLSELNRIYEADFISEIEYKELAERIGNKIKEFDTQINAYAQTKQDEIFREIEMLENEIYKRKIELEILNKIISKT